MLLAVGDGRDGKILIVGLEEENINRLKNDQPIEKDLSAIIPQLKDWTLYILGPEDTERFTQQYATKIKRKE